MKLSAILMAILLALTSAAGLASEETTEEPFSLWNPDAPARNALAKYLAAVTDEASPDYIPVKDRIAVFDLDGTFISVLGFLGGEMGLLLAVLIILFCWRKESGKRLALTFAAVNAWLPMIKAAVMRPRPYMEHPSL